MARRFHSFAEFYPYYLAEHRDRTNRRLHFAGQVAAVGLLAAALVTLDWRLVPAAPVAGYALAWVGHLAFERNRPATFRHPAYSLLGDLVMCKDMLTGKVKF
jgi:hypothetical protein